MDIRSQQKAVIQRMFNLNEEDSTDQKFQGVWKVLVYDRFAQDLLSPLISVGELRATGITLHMLISNKRERVPDVPAIYFVRPTEENINIIAQDCANGLYDSCYLNFTSSLPRHLLESLAQQTIKSNSFNRIRKLFDQYTEFIALESNLLSLSHPNSYMRLNGAATDDQMMQYIDEMVDSLFSVVVTMGVVPVIRAMVGHAAQMVGQKLNQRLWDHCRSRNNLFTSNQALSFQRPLLVLTDRNVDISVPLHHPWTYRALCKDLLQFQSNRCTVTTEGNDQKESTKTYDLSSADLFWRTSAGNPFPKVAEGVEVSLKKYQQEVQDLGLNNRNDSMEEFEGTDGLASAINSLPQLKRKKELLDMHTIIATGILKEIKRREIDAYFSLEADLIAKTVVDKKTLLEQLAPDAKGTPRDKLRLLCIYIMSSNLSDSDISECLATLNWSEQPGVSPSDVNALEYLKQFKFTHRLASTQADPSQSAGSSAGGGGLFGKLANTVYGSTATGITGLVAGVRNLLPSSTNLPLTKTVGELMENRETPETDKYVYYDPKSSSPSEVRVGRQEKPFKDAFVFVFGGGNYNEYQNLQDYAAKVSTPQLARSIAYGSTEMLSGEEFLEQLIVLGTPEGQRGHVSVD